MWSNKEADFFPEINKSFTFPGMGLQPNHSINVTQHELIRLFEGDIKADILNSTYCLISNGHFDTNFHIIFLSKVIDNLISNSLITLKINYQDIGRQSY